ncbi:hypothetical protein niasHS_008820 [Heterodera schachtii]|uniref:Uncharacterized protein n=1 Tax=Heterodera schachtii TaxID=97005 RepID=A0ABD2J4T2_HETSC
MNPRMNMSVEECKVGYEYCAAFTCTKAGRAGFSRIQWYCAKIKSHFCAEVFTKLVAENITHSKGHKCQCHFGEMGQDMGNEQFVLPPIPDGMKCKVGQFDANEIGQLSEGKCLHDDHYCYIAKCTKDNEYFQTVWDCTDRPISAHITDQIGQKAEVALYCDALFGKKDMAMSNEHFTIEKLEEQVEMIKMMTTKKRRRPKKSTTITTPSTEFATTTMPTVTKQTVPATVEEATVMGYYRKQRNKFYDLIIWETAHSILLPLFSC